MQLLRKFPHTILLVILLFVVGCATLYPTIPDGYNGPIASIKDSEKRIDSGKSDIFYLSHIDKNKIYDSRTASRKASHGGGNKLNSALLENNVPVGVHLFTIVGRTEYAMPARALAGTVYEVKGDVEFSPDADGKYIIKGLLSEERSSVWIENVSTGEVVGEVKVEGPSKLGFFEK